MKRLHVHVAVDNLADSIRFYSGIRWETFHTLDSIPVYGGHSLTQPMPASCCTPTAKSACC